MNMAPMYPNLMLIQLTKSLLVQVHEYVVHLIFHLLIDRNISRIREPKILNQFPIIHRIKNITPSFDPTSSSIVLSKSSFGITRCFKQ